MEPNEELLTTPVDNDSADLGVSTAELADDDDYVSVPLASGSPTSADQRLPETLDPSSLDDESLMAELEKRKHLYERPSAANPTNPDPRIAQIVELSQSNPQMAEALRLQLAEERAAARILEHITPTLAPIVQREAIQKSGLSEQGQQYLADTFSKMPGADVAALMHNPLTRDVLTRAAKQYESERTTRKAHRYESAASESPTLSAEDWQAIRDFERMTGDRVDPDVISNARKGF